MKIQIPARFFSNIDIPGSAPVLIFGSALLKLGSGNSRHLMRVPIGTYPSSRRLADRGDGFDLSFSLVRKEGETAPPEAFDDDYQDAYQETYPHSAHESTNSTTRTLLLAGAAVLAIGLICCSGCVCIVGWTRQTTEATIPEDCKPRERLPSAETDFCSLDSSFFEVDNGAGLCQGDPEIRASPPSIEFRQSGVSHGHVAPSYLPVMLVQSDLSDARRSRRFDNGEFVRKAPTRSRSDDRDILP